MRPKPETDAKECPWLEPERCMCTAWASAPGSGLHRAAAAAPPQLTHACRADLTPSVFRASASCARAPGPPQLPGRFACCEHTLWLNEADDELGKA